MPAETRPDDRAHAGDQLHRPALAGGGQQRVGEDDGPASIGRIDDRPPAVADDPDERLQLGDERLAGRDPQLDDVALECRRVPADEPRLCRVRRPGERQALGQVVELEHALLAEDGQLAALGRRQPVDVEHGDRAGREDISPNSRSSWSAWIRRAVSADTRAGRSPAIAHRMSTSWVARSTVTPTSRMRAGNGPDATARDREDRRQPARLEQPPELEDGRIEALDMADLDGRRAGAPMPRRRSGRPPPASRPAASRRGRRCRARARPGSSGRWLVVGAAMTTASRSASASIAIGSRRPGRRTAVAAARAPGSGSAMAARRTPGSAPSTRRWFRPIVPSPISPTRISRSPTGDQAPVIARPLGRAARALERRPDRGPDRGDDRALVLVREAREHRQRQGRRPPRSVTGRSAWMPRSSTYGWRWTGIG